MTFTDEKHMSRILVVEDEPGIALGLEDVEGAQDVAGPARIRGGEELPDRRTHPEMI